jgi:4,5-DOPA dioxygenase extradiol
MTRKEFIKLCGVLSVSPLLAKDIDKKKELMPALFISHGSPMNIVQNNSYTKALSDVAKTFKKPKAIVVVSAHWYDDRTYISASDKQKTIYDFYGFPKPLYEIKYEPKGSPKLASKVKEILEDDSFLVDRGLDHGAWSVLTHMYPNQDISTFQLSINKNLDYDEYFKIGEMLKILRSQDILVMGSGGVVHNLRAMKYPPYDIQIDEWALEFDQFVAKSFVNKNFEDLIEAKFHKYFNISHPFDDHFIPLLYVAGLVNPNDQIDNFYEDIVEGNLSMRCIKVG